MNTSISRPSRDRQGGVALLFALLTLVAMSLAMMALVRTVDTSGQLLGNIGFKQDATAAADQAARQAISWLSANKASLANDMAAGGYYASTKEFASDGITPQPPADVSGQQLRATNNRQLVDWDGNSCAGVPSSSYTGCSLTTAAAGTINGNAARYVIFRLCSKPGEPSADPGVRCSLRPPDPKACAGSKGTVSYGDMPLPCAGPSAYYRIVVRVLGARNTTSFTETLVHF